ncbi:hypothetical protein Y032_0219g2446 [Ancylostoma ceylanicum]|uniref:Uncharacterized protein n=1 Tax=Ancylostoma ceylanicum TaxID=53326 RepID=A0A016SIL0_9BILA|nr:hypothetical protein Y032_0219g2446 [Ancylostoma ceylanicum]
MWTILPVLALAAVEAGLYGVPPVEPYGAPSMEPPYRPSYTPQFAPSYPFYMPWWFYGRHHHHHWWSDSESSEHHRPHHHHDHHHYHYPAKPACSLCTKLGRVYAENSTTMASIQYIEQSNGCMQVILGCPVSNGSFLLVREKGSTEVKGIAAGVGIKLLLECTRERKWSPYTINGMNVEAVGCVEMPAAATEAILDLNFTQPVPIMKQKRHTVEDKADLPPQPSGTMEYSDHEEVLHGEEIVEDEEEQLQQVHPEKQHL